MIPNIERVIAEHLRDDDTVADIVGRRVVADPPDKRDTPWVRVIVLDAPQGDVADHLVGFLVQLDCYAGKDEPGQRTGQPQASLLARCVRQAMQTMSTSTHHDYTVVSGVRFTGMLRLPDTDMEPARERVILTAIVHAHS